jgi:hypothetical protein
VLVWIVAAALPDNSGMDVERINKVEDLHPELARAMLGNGTGREPTADEVAEYERQQAKRDNADGETAEEPEAQPEQLTAEAPARKTRGEKPPTGTAPVEGAPEQATPQQP